MRMLLVVFHMLGCPHCPPALEAAASSGLPIVTVESAHPLAQALNITSYPTIILSSEKCAFDYGNRSRTPDALAAWALEKAYLLDVPQN